MADEPAPADAPAPASASVPVPASALPLSADPAADAERERDATDRLSRIHGAGELQAVLLALLMAPGSKRALRAWQRETAATVGADALRRHAACLSGAARLPWFELLLSRLPTIRYVPDSEAMPRVQCAPTPKLPLPLLMPLSLSPVGRSANTERAKRLGPPGGRRPNLVARRTSPTPLSETLP